MLCDFHTHYGRFLVIIKTQKANSPTNKQPETKNIFKQNEYRVLIQIQTQTF